MAPTLIIVLYFFVNFFVVMNLEHKYCHNWFLFYSRVYFSVSLFLVLLNCSPPIRGGSRILSRGVLFGNEEAVAASAEREAHCGRGSGARLRAPENFCNFVPFSCNLRPPDEHVATSKWWQFLTGIRGG